MWAIYYSNFLTIFITDVMSLCSVYSHIRQCGFVENFITSVTRMIVEIIFCNDNKFSLSIRAKFVKIIHNLFSIYNYFYNENIRFAFVSFGFWSLLVTISLRIIFYESVFCIDNAINII